MHIWDGVTPVEEIVQTLGNLVRAGKIRYYGLSDMLAWLAMKAATIASERRTPGPIAIQVEYSLVARDVEAEHVPAAREGGMGVLPWSPLVGGFLTGKYRRENMRDTGRLSGPNPFGDTKFSDRNYLSHPRRAQSRGGGDLPLKFHPAAFRVPAGFALLPIVGPPEIRVMAYPVSSGSHKILNP